MSTVPTTSPADTPPSGQPDWTGPQKFATAAAVIGFGLFGIVGGVNLASEHGKTELLSAYLAGWMFWLSLPVGGMALLMIHYLAKTSWGVLLKRPLESATRTLPLMVVLFVPFAALSLLWGHESPYPWVDPQEREITPEIRGALTRYDAAMAREASGEPGKLDPKDGSIVLQLRAEEHERHDREHGNLGFLTPPVFLAASAAYFLIWGTFIFFLNKWGQDAESDPTKVPISLERLKNISGPGLIVYAITLTAAASHWVMSLETGWASTMFPVIVVIEQFLITLTFCVAVFLSLVSRHPFKDVMRPKFQLDMGSLMLAFTLFWTYTSFSQMMLIWIGNLPEEIPFYLKRSNNTGWWYVSAGLIVFHFAVPFLLLLFRDIKLHPARLRVMAIYLLVVCAVDVVWWVEPTHPHESPLFVLMDLGAVVGIGGVWGLLFINQLKKRPLLPTNETYQLPEGHHEHH